MDPQKNPTNTAPSNEEQTAEQNNTAAPGQEVNVDFGADTSQTPPVTPSDATPSSSSAGASGVNDEMPSLSSDEPTTPLAAVDPATPPSNSGGFTPPPASGQPVDPTAGYNSDVPQDPLPTTPVTPPDGNRLADDAAPTAADLGHTTPDVPATAPHPVHAADKKMIIVLGVVAVVLVIAIIALFMR